MLKSKKYIIVFSSLLLLFFCFFGCTNSNINIKPTTTSTTAKIETTSNSVNSTTTSTTIQNTQPDITKIFFNSKKINPFDFSFENYDELLDKNEVVKVWSAANTVRYTQNERVDNYIKANINIECAKNESEAAQIIITPMKDIKSYNIQTFDLINGNKTISKNNIKVYREYYLAIDKGINAVFYPDALIPIQKSFEKGENTIQKDENQGIWITVNVPSDAQAGIYNSKINILIDGKTIQVPIKVKVFNFALPSEISSKSAFSFHDFDVPQTDENMTMYYNFFLNYKITTTGLPIAKPGNLTNYQYALKAKEYILKKNVTGFAIYYITKYATHPIFKVDYYTVDYDDLKARIIELCKQSTNQINILDKAYLYLGQILDEPSKGNYWRVKEVCSKLETMKKEIAKDTSIFPLNGSKNKVKSSLLNLRNIVTTAMQYDVPQNNNLDNGNFIGYINTWCPLVNHYNDDEYLYWKDLRLKQNDKMWAYICDLPDAPYPTYHIDDSLISMREFSWMRKKNNIEGELYWATTIYKKYDGVAYVARDIWSDPYSYPRAPGEGFLVYPGARYNMQEPIPTIRLEQIRDGIEDYEYISILEKELNKANIKYGTNFNVNKYIENLYNSMFEGTISNDNSIALKKSREEIVMLIEAIQSKSNAIIDIDNSQNSNNVRINIYSNKGTSIIINGEKLKSTNTKNGILTSFDVDLAFDKNGIDVTLLNSNEKINVERFIGSKKNSLMLFNENNISMLRKSEYNPNDSFEDIKLNFLKNVFGREGSFLQAKINGLSNISLGYKHYIKVLLDTNSSNKIFDDTQNINFWVYNNSNIGERIYLSLKGNGKEKEITYKYARPKVWTFMNFDISNVVINKNEINEIKLSVQNVSKLNAELYFDEINATK